MSISKEDYAIWRADPATKAFFSACDERVEDAKEVLANQAGEDSSRDSFFRGLIFAYREIGGFRVDDVVPTQEEETE